MRPRTLIAALILLGVACPLWAAPPKPTAVLQLKPIDEWLGDLKYVATKFGPLGEKLGGDAGDKKLEEELAKMLGPDWRKAIDTTRPLGGYAIIKDKIEEGTFVGMVPVKDVKALIALLGNFGVMPEEKDGLFSIQLPNKGMTTSYARAANGYIYVGSSAEAVAQDKLLKPDDLFGAKETSALVLRYRLDSIPQEEKKKFIEEKKKEATEQFERLIREGGSGESQASKEFGKSMIESLLKVYRDGREWTLRLDFDRKTGEVGLVTEIIPMPGTELAKEYREAKPIVSRFAALDSGNTGFLGMTCGLPLSMMFDEGPKERGKAVEELQKSLAESGIKIDKATAEKAMKIFAAAAPTDDTDIAFIFYSGEKGKDTTLVALHIKEGTKAEAALVDLIKEVPADVRDRVKLNAGKIGTVNLHRIDLGKDAPKDFEKHFGTSEVVAAIAPEALYVAFGPDADARIKAALSTKPKPAPMFIVDASAAALRKFTEETIKDEKARSETMKTLDTLTKGVDRVRLVHLTRTSGESMKYRFGVNLVAILQIVNAVSSTDSGTKATKPAGKDAPKAPQPPAPKPPDLKPPDFGEKPTAARPRAILTGHESSVDAVVFSPDGKTVFSAGEDHSIRKWDAANGKQLAVLKGHEGRIKCLAISPDGKSLVSGGGDRRNPELKLWDVPSGKSHALGAHEASVICVAFADDGKSFASGDGTAALVGANKGTVVVWDIESRTTRWVEQVDMAVDSIAFSKDGKSLAIGGDTSKDSGVLRLLDATTGKVTAKLDGRFGSVMSLVFTADDKSLVSGSEDGFAKVWDLATAKERASCSWDNKYASISHLALTSDGETVIMLRPGSEQVKLWHPATGRTRDVLHIDRSNLRGMAVSHDGKQLAVGNNKDVALWGLSLALSQFALQPMIKAELKGHEQDIRAIAISPDGKLLASGSHEGNFKDKNIVGVVKLWDLETGKEVATLKGRALNVLALTFTPDGKQLVSVSAARDPRKFKEYGDVQVWDVETRKEVGRFQGHDKVVYAAAVSKDGKYVATAAYDGTVKLWELATGTLVRTFKGKAGEYLMCVAFSPDGKLLAAGSMDKVIHVWETSEPTKELFTLQGHRGWVTSLSFSPDGKTLASGSADSTVRFWDPATGKELDLLRLPTEQNVYLAYSSDGKTLAVAGAKFMQQGALCIFDVASRTQKTSAEWDKGLAWGLAITPDAKRIAIIASETVRIWEVPGPK